MPRAGRAERPRFCVCTASGHVGGTTTSTCTNPSPRCRDGNLEAPKSILPSPRASSASSGVHQRPAPARKLSPPVAVRRTAGGHKSRLRLPRRSQAGVSAHGAQSQRQEPVLHRRPTKRGRRACDSPTRECAHRTTSPNPPGQVDAVSGKHLPARIGGLLASSSPAAKPRAQTQMDDYLIKALGDMELWLA